MVQSDARGVVSKRDPVFFKRTLDPPVGLSADLELLARRCLHFAAEYLDPGVDAVELGLERHIDDLGELGIRVRRCDSAPSNRWRAWYRFPRCGSVRSRRLEPVFAASRSAGSSNQASPVSVANRIS